MTTIVKPKADTAKKPAAAKKAEVAKKEGRGRPVVLNSARQIRLAERADKESKGIVVKPGRPKSEDKPVKVKKEKVIKVKPEPKPKKVKEHKQTEATEPEAALLPVTAEHEDIEGGVE